MSHRTRLSIVLMIAVAAIIILPGVMYLRQSSWQYGILFRHNDDSASISLDGYHVESYTYAEDFVYRKWVTDKETGKKHAEKLAKEDRWAIVVHFKADGHILKEVAELGTEDYADFKNLFYPRCGNEARLLTWQGRKYYPFSGLDQVELDTSWEAIGEINLFLNSESGLIDPEDPYTPAIIPEDPATNNSELLNETVYQSSEHEGWLYVSHQSRYMLYMLETNLADLHSWYIHHDTHLFVRDERPGYGLTDLQELPDDAVFLGICTYADPYQHPVEELSSNRRENSAKGVYAYEYEGLLYLIVPIPEGQWNPETEKNDLTRYDVYHRTYDD